MMRLCDKRRSVDVLNIFITGCRLSDDPSKFATTKIIETWN